MLSGMNEANFAKSEELDRVPGKPFSDEHSCTLDLSTEASKHRGTSGLRAADSFWPVSG